ncbi:MAG TPA: Gfo/Idh/MocA family oxidoreductase [Kiritimatiellia bacterium]|nr:Gfo/Idh/MocA family oxidoreductase [Kiritimatiellia bacterium]
MKTTTTSDAPPVRLGLIGAGNMGAQHARSVLAGRIPGCTLGAVCDVDPARLAGYDGVRTFTDASALIASREVDAVLVATPHPSHVQLGLAALRAGLHLLMEKPVAVHKAEALELLAEPRRGVFSMMFNQRTDPLFNKVRELVHGGALGTVRRFTWTITDWFRTNAYYRSSPWRATWTGEGGGVLINQACHNLDLLQWIFGMPAQVLARAVPGRFHPIEVEDDVTALLEYPDGMTGVFITTSGEAPGVNRLEIAGERGLLVLDGEQLTFRRLEVPLPEYTRTAPDGYRKPQAWEIQIPVAGGRGPQHEGILRNFTNAIRHGEPLIAPGPEGLHATELINAMLLSAFSGKPVSLPLNAEAYRAWLDERRATSRRKEAP